MKAEMSTFMTNGLVIIGSKTLLGGRWTTSLSTGSTPRLKHTNVEINHVTKTGKKTSKLPTYLHVTSTIPHLPPPNEFQSWLKYDTSLQKTPKKGRRVGGGVGEGRQTFTEGSKASFQSIQITLWLESYNMTSSRRLELWSQILLLCFHEKKVPRVFKLPRCFLIISRHNAQGIIFLVYYYFQNNFFVSL